MSTSPWSILQIEPTHDERAIKRAYAKLIRGIDQEAEPGAYQRVREAYEAALAEARTKAKAPPASTSNPEIFDTAKTRGFMDVFVNALDIHYTLGTTGKVLIDYTIPSPSKGGNAGYSAPLENWIHPTQVYAKHPEHGSGSIFFQSSKSLSATVRHLAETIAQALVEEGEEAAVARLNEIMSRPDMVSIDMSWELEGYLLEILAMGDGLPVKLARAAAETFHWSSHENPFKYHDQHGQIHAWVMSVLARLRAREQIVSYGAKPRKTKWEEVENTLFSAFDKARIRKLNSSSQQRKYATRLIKFALSQEYHPYEQPIPSETIEWWAHNTMELHEHNNKSHNPLVFILPALIFMAIIVIKNGWQFRQSAHPSSMDFLDRLNEQQHRSQPVRDRLNTPYQEAHSHAARPEPFRINEDESSQAFRERLYRIQKQEDGKDSQPDPQRIKLTQPEESDEAFRKRLYRIRPEALNTPE